LGVGMAVVVLAVAFLIYNYGPQESSFTNSDDSQLSDKAMVEDADSIKESNEDTDSVKSDDTQMIDKELELLDSEIDDTNPADFQSSGLSDL